jgi:glycosyltransferase involved in cell wall biosynthesis
LEPQKGHRYLLRAITQIRATFPELTVVAIGREGNASAALRKEAAELGVDTHVRWEGHRDDVVRYLWAADLLVLSSTNEGLGGVVIEAMLTETPVVASNLPGIQEISLDGEFVTLVPAAEPERLAEAIRATLDEKEALRDRAARALAHAQESFSIEAAAQNLSEIYDRAIVEAP